MKEGRTLPVIQPGVDAGLSRRAALQTLAAGIGASIAAPGFAEAAEHPVHKHTAHVAEQAKKLRMEDEVLDAARQNLAVWELYLNGIGDAGDELNKQLKRDARSGRRKAA